MSETSSTSSESQGKSSSSLGKVTGDQHLEGLRSQVLDYIRKSLESRLKNLGAIEKEKLYFSKISGKYGDVGEVLDAKEVDLKELKEEAARILKDRLLDGYCTRVKATDGREVDKYKLQSQVYDFYDFYELALLYKKAKSMTEEDIKKKLFGISSKEVKDHPSLKDKYPLEASPFEKDNKGGLVLGILQSGKIVNLIKSAKANYEKNNSPKKIEPTEVFGKGGTAPVNDYKRASENEVDALDILFNVFNDVDFMKTENNTAMFWTGCGVDLNDERSAFWQILKNRGVGGMLEALGDLSSNKFTQGTNGRYGFLEAKETAEIVAHFGKLLVLARTLEHAKTGNSTARKIAESMKNSRLIWDIFSETLARRASGVVYILSGNVYPTSTWARVERNELIENKNVDMIVELDVKDPKKVKSITLTKEWKTLKLKYGKNFLCGFEKDTKLVKVEAESHASPLGLMKTQDKGKIVKDNVKVK